MLQGCHWYEKVDYVKQISNLKIVVCTVPQSNEKGAALRMARSLGLYNNIQCSKKASREHKGLPHGHWDTKTGKNGNLVIAGRIMVP